MLESPLTGSRDITLIKIIQTEKLIRAWMTSLNIDISEELNDYKEIYLYKCNQTKLNFFLPSDVAGSGKLYEQLQKFDWFYMPHKWEHSIALQDLHDCQTVLEVGSAFGDFVKSAIEQGLNIQGLELNRSAASIAQSKKLPVFPVDLQEFANLNPESQDAVCSFQVLEHVPNPKEFIEWSIKSLKPNGKLIFCVPNAESFLKYQYNLLDMPPHHMLQWSKAAFKALEDLFPIRLEKVLREPLAPYHIFSFVDSYSEHFKSITPLSFLAFNRLTIPIYEKLLKLGLRKVAVGQSLYVLFRKLS